MNTYIKDYCKRERRRGEIVSDLAPRMITFGSCHKKRATTCLDLKVPQSPIANAGKGERLVTRGKMEKIRNGALSLVPSTRKIYAAPNDIVYSVTFLPRCCCCRRSVCSGVNYTFVVRCT